jgi:general secretion pathway protein D
MNRRIFYWFLVANFCFATFSVATKAHAQSAGTFYKRGTVAEDKDDVDGAYENYAKAYKLKPQDLRYRTAYYRVLYTAASLHVKRGEALRAKNDFTGAITEFLHALEIDPSNELAQQDIVATRLKMAAPPNQETSVGPSSPLDEAGSPPELKPLSNEPITLHMTEDAKNIYQAVGKAAGINVLFDPEYNSKRFTVDLNNVSVYEALRIIGTLSGTFWRPITPNAIFVAQNTRAKRTELDEQAVRTFYLENASQQTDLNDVVTALRNLLTNAKLYGVPSQNAIVMRATPDELLLAQKLVDDLDKAKPEVVVDVDVLEVNRDKIRTIGLNLPGSISFQLQSATTPNTSSTDANGNPVTTNNLTLNDLGNLNAKNFGVTVGAATANLMLSDSDTKVLQSPRLRATDGQNAKLKIGSRIPIATGSYSTGTTATAVSGLVNTQFQYVDIGTSIEITPTVHYDRDITLKVKVELTSQTGNVTISGVSEPIISQRTAEQVVRLKEGEANILAGLDNKADNKTVGGTPFLGEIPILKYLFSSTEHEVQDDEIVFMLIPHIVRGSLLDPLNLRTIDSGTGSSVEIRRVQPANVVIPNGSVANPAVPAPVAQTVNRNPAAAQTTVPPPVAGTPPAQPGATSATPPAGEPVSFSLVGPQTPQAVGSTFQVAVNLAGGKDIFSVPLQIQYDTAHLSLLNVESGNFLNRDGQAVALVHRDDGSGGLAISASRPPGATGVGGAGTVCVLTFQTKAAGDAGISISKPGAVTSTQQQLPARGAQVVVHVK